MIADRKTQLYIPPGLVYTAESVADMSSSKNDNLEKVTMYFDVKFDDAVGGTEVGWNVRASLRVSLLL